MLLDVAVVSWAAARGALLRLLGGSSGAVIVVAAVGLDVVAAVGLDVLLAVARVDVLVFLGLTLLLGLAASGVNLAMAAARCSAEKVVVVGRGAALA